MNKHAFFCSKRREMPMPPPLVLSMPRCCGTPVHQGSGVDAAHWLSELTAQTKQSRDGGCCQTLTHCLGIHLTYLCCCKRYNISASPGHVADRLISLGSLNQPSVADYK